MQTLILLTIALFVAIGLGFFCFDFYQNRTRSVDPQAFNKLSPCDLVSVTPLDTTSMADAEEMASLAIDPSEHWLKAVGHLITGLLHHH